MVWRSQKKFNGGYYVHLNRGGNHDTVFILTTDGYICAAVFISLADFK